MAAARSATSIRRPPSTSTRRSSTCSIAAARSGGASIGSAGTAMRSSCSSSASCASATILAKRRTPVPIDALGQLDGELLPQDWSGRWFHARLAARRLRPVCQVSYRRTGSRRGSRRGCGPADPRRCAALRQPAGRDALSRSGAARRSSTGADSRVEVPASAAGAVQAPCREFALTPQPASKYRLGMVGDGPGGDRRPPSHRCTRRRLVQQHV